MPARVLRHPNCRCTMVPALEGALRSTNAREGITTVRQEMEQDDAEGGGFEKHQCPRGYYDALNTKAWGAKSATRL